MLFLFLWNFLWSILVIWCVHDNFITFYNTCLWALKRPLHWNCQIQIKYTWQQEQRILLISNINDNYFLYVQEHAYFCIGLWYFVWYLHFPANVCNAITCTSRTYSLDIPIKVNMSWIKKAHGNSLVMTVTLSCSTVILMHCPTHAKKKWLVWPCWPFPLYNTSYRALD